MKFDLGRGGSGNQPAAVAGFLKSDVLKVVVYVAATLLLGAALAPVVYNVGMAIGEVSEGRQTNRFIDWLGAAALRSADNFPRFFDRALLLSAVVLMVPLVWSLRLGRGERRFRDTPWTVRLPDSVTVRDRGQPLRPNPHGWAHLLLGFALAGGLLLISGWLMVQAGFFVWRDAELSTRGAVNYHVGPIEWGRALRKALPTAVTVAVIEEILFRGILLGIFLRAMRPAAAIVSLSLLFSFVHFLDPAPGVVVADPEAADAGFVLLGHIFQKFTDPVDLLGRFALLTAVGVVLAVARWRTASLWLPIGLHAGWVFCYAIFKSAALPVIGLPEMARWLVGGTLMEGLLPLLAVVITGFIVAMVTRPREDEEMVE